MENYLKGFNDGYKKALELTGKNNTTDVAVTIDGKAVAKRIYKDITLLQEKEKRTKEGFM